MYMLDSIKPSLNEYSNIEFVKLNGFEDLEPEKFNLKEDEVLLLVDDFIGSGGTLNSTLQELEKNESINDKFVILSVMIQSDTLGKLNESGIKTVIGESTLKGISNFYDGEDLVQKSSIMSEIERLIPKVKNYRFGFENSEALVTMAKTPNNTFPIFWKDFQKKGKLYKAPFARY